jgi:hypothetical protein
MTIQDQFPHRRVTPAQRRLGRRTTHCVDLTGLVLTGCEAAA